jgi:murein DD-endopeptidase MepM/ murein hydrolase activator NlpD
MHSSRWTALGGIVLFSLVAGCGGGGEDNGGSGNAPPPGPALQNVVDPEPGPTNTVIRLFRKPFDGDYRVLNYFDHDQPIAPNDSNGYQLNWQGARAYPGRDLNGYDGHRGVDWLLPPDTPIYAVTNGEITFAGNRPMTCFLQDNQPVENPIIVLRLVAPDGISYSAIYVHMNRIDVATGDIVTEGQQLGLSGARGCVGKAGTPHLHFELERINSLSPLQVALIDPYGWEGPTPDPWSIGRPDRASIWFWKQGQAPDLVVR